MAADAGNDGALAMQRAMFATVDEVGRAAAAEGIDCHYAKGGYLHLATNPAHTVRLRDELAEARRFGLGEDDLRWLDRAEAAERLDAAGVLGALYTPHCAAIHPARLARGLARAVERRGATIHEGTRATAIEPGRVVDRPRHGAGRDRRAGHGGVHVEPRRRAADAGAALLAHDRHRAAGRRRRGRRSASATGRPSTTPAT